MLGASAVRAAQDAGKTRSPGAAASTVAKAQAAAARGARQHRDSDESDGRRRGGAAATAGGASADSDSMREMFDLTYARAGDGSATSIHGWNSSYHGGELSAATMEQWRQSTLSRIAGGGPIRDVFEFGVGTGLLLVPLASRRECRRYHGCDMSRVVVEQVRRHVGAWRRDNACAGDTEVRVFTSDADAVELVEPDAALPDDAPVAPRASFDVVIINSVAQYFPSMKYLSGILHLARQLLRPGGRVFIGDVRNADTLPEFATSVAAFKAGLLPAPDIKAAPAAVASDGDGVLPSPDADALARLHTAAAQKAQRDPELCVPPAYWYSLARSTRAFASARVSMKDAPPHLDSEVAAYRYDATLYASEDAGDDAGGVAALQSAVDPRVAVSHWDNDTDVGSWVERACADAKPGPAPEVQLLVGVPDARIWAVSMLLEQAMAAAAAQRRGVDTDAPSESPRGQQLLHGASALRHMEEGIVPVHPSDVFAAAASARVDVHPASRGRCHISVCKAELPNAATLRALADALVQASAVAEVPGLCRAVNEAARVEVDTALYLDTAIARVCDASPDRIALVSEDDVRVPFAGLLKMADWLALELVTAGIPAGSVVCVSAQKSARYVAALLGVLRAGCAYCFVEPTWPAARIERVARTARSTTFVADGAFASVFTTDSVGGTDDSHGIEATTLIVLDEMPLLGAADMSRADANSADPDLGRLLQRLQPTEAPAYVNFTSGSSGQAKGVLISHASAHNLAVGCAAIHGGVYNSEDVVAQTGAQSFDFHVQDIFGVLLAGATVVVLRHQGTLDFSYLLDRLERHTVTNMHMVPSLARMFFDHLEAARPSDSDARTWSRLASLRRFLFGGERLPPRLVWLLYRRLPDCEVWNTYGPTEATVTCLQHRIPPEAVGAAVDSEPKLAVSIPLGLPLPNYEVFVLDPVWPHRVVEPGSTGVLHIGGPGVMQEYLGEAALTDAAVSFVAGRRCYNTGDLVMQTEGGGALQFVGRMDDQFKLRGQRLEPAEVEAVLQRDDDVRDALVVKQTAPSGEDALVAYVVCSASDMDSVPGRLREECRAALPAFAVPSAFVLVDCIPITANGKADQRRLPAPDWGGARRTATGASAGGGGGGGGESIGGGIEDTVLAVIAELLAVDVRSLDRSLSFVEAGGNSLIATRAVARLRSIVSSKVTVKNLLNGDPLDTMVHKLALLSTDCGDLGKSACADSRSGRVLADLRDLVARTLGLEHEAVNTSLSFFDLGGNSLLATRFVADARAQVSKDISVALLFQACSLQALATRVAKQQEATGERGDAPLVSTKVASTPAHANPSTDADVGSDTLNDYDLGDLGFALCQAAGTAFVCLYTAICLAAMFIVADAVGWLVSWVGVVLGPVVSAVAVSCAMAIAAAIALLLAACGGYVGVKRLCVGHRSLQPGVFLRHGTVYLRVWLIERMWNVLTPLLVPFLGTPALAWYLSVLGARIGRNTIIHTLRFDTFDMVSLGSDVHVGNGTRLNCCIVEPERVILAATAVGDGCALGDRAVISAGSVIGNRSLCRPYTAVRGRVPVGSEVEGSPMRVVGSTDQREAMRSLALDPGVAHVYHVAAVLILVSLIWPALVARHEAQLLFSGAVGFAAGLVRLLAGALAFDALQLAVIFVLVRLVAGPVVPGQYRITTGHYARVFWLPRVYMHTHVLSLVTINLTGFKTAYLRALGASISQEFNVSGDIGLWFTQPPNLLEARGTVFLALDVAIGASVAWQGQRLVAPITFEGDCFAGNWCGFEPGSRVPARAVVGSLALVTPRSGTGNGEPLDRRDSGDGGFVIMGLPAFRVKFDIERQTAQDATWLDNRALEDLFVIVARRACWVAHVLPQLAALHACTPTASHFSLPHGIAWLCWCVIVACLGSTTVFVGLKWLLMGRIAPGGRAFRSWWFYRFLLTETAIKYWSSFVGEATAGSPLMAGVAAGLGCHLTGWRTCVLDPMSLSPECDLYTLGDGCVIQRGALIQAHTFESMVMDMKTITVGAGAVVGFDTNILPGCSVGDGVLVEPLSLVMRGETLRGRGESFQGNPTTRVEGRA